MMSYYHFCYFHHKIKQKSVKKYSKKSAFYIAQIGKYQAVLSYGMTSSAIQMIKPGMIFFSYIPRALKFLVA